MLARGRFFGLAELVRLVIVIVLATMGLVLAAPGAEAQPTPSITVDGGTGPVVLQYGGTDPLIEGVGFSSTGPLYVRFYAGNNTCSGPPNGYIAVATPDGSMAYVAPMPLPGLSSVHVLDVVAGITSNCVELFVDTADISTQTAEAGATQTADVFATQTVDAGATQTVEAGATQTVDAGATQTADAFATQTVDAGATQTVEAGATQTFEAGATQTADAFATQTAEAEATATADAGSPTATDVAPTATDVAPTATDVAPTATDVAPTATVELPGDVVVTITTNTGDPIPDDTVVCLEATCIDLDAEFSSDEAPNGSSITFSDLAPGTYAVTASVAGEAAFAGTVEVLAGETANVAIELQLNDDASPVPPTATTPAGAAPTDAPVVVLPNTGSGTGSSTSMLLLITAGCTLLMLSVLALRRTVHRV